MAENIAEALGFGAALPYVGPVCTIIQNVLDIIEANDKLRGACNEEIPKELSMMQTTLSMLSEGMSELDGEAINLRDGRLDQLASHMTQMYEIVDNFNKKTNRFTKALAAKETNARIEDLWSSLDRTKLDMVLLLGIFDATALRGLSQNMEQMRITQVSELACKVKLDQVRDTTNALGELEREYNVDVWLRMEKLETYRRRMGDRYAMAMVVPPILVTAEERGEILGHMRALWVFWKKIQRLCESGTDIFVGHRNWAGRGKAYRMLVEPLDIANWYFGEKNLNGVHYIDGILPTDEFIDNEKRPGRYILLQKKEAEMFGGQPASSLETAWKLKELLGNKSWKDLAPIDGS